MPPWIANRSLATKFVLMIFDTLVLTMSVVGYVYLQSQYEQSVNRLSDKGKTLGRFVSLISPPLVLSYDFEGMNDYMREISEDPDVIYGVLVSKNNVSLTRYLNKADPYVQQALHARGDASLLDIIDTINRSGDVMTLDFPIKFDGTDLARLVIGLDRAPIDVTFKKSLLVALAALAALIALIATVFYLGFHIMAMRPILALRAGLHRVAQGDLSGNIPVTAKDEIGNLTSAFNQMVDQLRHTIAEKDDIASQQQEQAKTLSQLNDNLEWRVEESERIMRDLHDDVGARLLTLSHRCENVTNAETARSALQYLRETIRGLGRKGITVQLADALADWEEEAKDRLDAAGIALDWQQPDNIPAVRLNNRQHINLGRILREAISNAIRHGTPKTIKAAVSIDDEQLLLQLCDDGSSGDPERWVPGTGVNNMSTRATELGGKVRWHEAASSGKSATRGICVEITCPLNQGD